ncbi:hypothetical protein OXX79_002805 [Metschnikowia pulcherrima]
MTTSVFVSGATGYIAQHILKSLVAKNYNVVGSVRTAEKGEKMKKLLASDKFSFEVVPDVEPAGAFDEALKKHPEVTVFLHTASPVQFQIKDIEQELLKPAINGTKNALSAIQAYGPQIKNVVVTSSYSAILTASKQSDPSFVATEESWNPITWEEAKTDPQSGYNASKTFAEKALWDFVKTEKPNFKVNVVNPVYVFGPQAFDAEVKGELNFSAEIINKLLKLKPDSDVPSDQGGFVDVRDVAKAHLAAFEKGFSNERLFMVSERFAGQDLLDILNENFPSLKGKIPVGKPGAGEEVKAGRCKLDNSKTRELLGFPLIDLKTCVVDSLNQIFRTRDQK